MGSEDSEGVSEGPGNTQSITMYQFKRTRALVTFPFRQRCVACLWLATELNILIRTC
jgi:hypothetical protein